MAAYLSTGGEGAGFWLHAPVDDITPLSNQHFKIATKLRLNKHQTTTAAHPCRRHAQTSQCKCNVTPQMHHVLQCPYGPHRNRRHNALRDQQAKIIKNITGTEPYTEQLLPHTTSTRRPTKHPDDDNDGPALRADVTMQTATALLHLDVMITSAFTQHALAGNRGAETITPGTAGEHAENYKRQKYAPHSVVPIVFEACGRIGSSALDFLRNLTNTLPEAERNAAYYKALQQLSTTLQLHNAKAIEAYLHDHCSTQHAAQRRPDTRTTLGPASAP